MLDQMVRDYTESIREAESAVAQTIGNLRMIEDDHREDVQAAGDWGRKALAASQKADEYRNAGNTPNADKFDALARVALQRQMQSESEAKGAEPTIASQTEVVEKLKQGLDTMRGKLQQLSSKRDELNARAEDGAGAVAGAGRDEEHRHHGPDQRGQPLRAEDPPRGGPCARRRGAAGVQPRRPVRGARGPRRADRGGGAPRRAEVRRIRAEAGHVRRVALDRIHGRRPPGRRPSSSAREFRLRGSGSPCHDHHRNHRRRTHRQPARPPLHLHRPRRRHRNSRGPETLTDLIDELGEHARAATVEEVAEAGEIVVVTIPLKSIDSVPVAPLAGKVVIDTDNYYPERDGHIAELDDETTTTAEMLQRHLPESKVVKAFNHIYAADLTEHGTPAGTPDRRALVIAGDDAEAKATVTSILDSFGYDTVDAGPLAEGWRIQRDTPGYGPRLDADGLRQALAEAKRYRDM